MPMIDVYAAADLFPANADRQLAEELTAALLKAEGTQAADYRGVINTEKHLDIDQAWRFVTVGGLITQIAAYWCQAQLYRRLAVKRYDEIEVLA